MKCLVTGGAGFIGSNLALELEKLGYEVTVVDNFISGSENILNLAIKNNAKLIYASTANLYGNGPVPMKEGQEKDIITAYGKSKLIMDEIAEKNFGRCTLSA